MINERQVIDAVLATLRGTDPDDLPVGDLTAPDPAPDIYGVLELPPGGNFEGTYGCPEDATHLRIRIRAVATDDDPTVARKACTQLLHQLRSRLADRAVPISGTGWMVTGRVHLGHGGIDDEGPSVNATDDWDLYVSE